MKAIGVEKFWMYQRYGSLMLLVRQYAITEFFVVYP